MTLSPGDRVILKFKYSLPASLVKQLSDRLNNFLPEGVTAAIIGSCEEVVVERNGRQ
jgi:hypothetical protein